MPQLTRACITIGDWDSDVSYDLGTGIASHRGLIEPPSVISFHTIISIFVKIIMITRRNSNLNKHGEVL